MNQNKKAEELIEKFGNLAVDVVDEILELLWKTHKNETEYRLWQQVKELIINKK